MPDKELSELVETYKNAFQMENPYHSILENMKEGFQLISFDWCYLYVNTTVIEQSKFSREELIGHKMTDKYPGFENTTTFKILKQCMDERIAKSIENKFTFPDNTIGWFDLSVQPVKEGLFILSMDITKRKEAESLKEQHINEIEQLLYKISHEVRQPVCQLEGFSYLLDKDLISATELNIFLKSIKEAIGQLNHSTKALTEFVSEMKMNADNDLPYSLYPRRAGKTG